MAEPIDAQERRELCDLLIQVGPDAPTLCEGWTTSDLAAHLVLRERFPSLAGRAPGSREGKGMDGADSPAASRSALDPVAGSWHPHHAQRIRVLHPSRGRAPSQWHGAAHGSSGSR
ncbi:MAG: maleylpyruvate isomerase family mycothiol-dependent enzyme [Candidatus Dormibacteria bacterium]